MKKIFARIGMSCEVSDEEHEKLAVLMKDNLGEAAHRLHELFMARGKFDGVDYLPASCDDNPNIEDDFEF